MKSPLLQYGTSLVKICGITNVEDALEAVRLGARYLGFVFAESPRRCEPQTAKHIGRILGGDVKTVGVFTEESDEVLRIIDTCQLDFAQLHGGQRDEFAQRIGADWVIRAIRVRDESSIEAIADYPSARHYLLDTYRAGIPGGTGETFSWDLALLAEERFQTRVFLSGGLTPENVREAILKVHPWAVDVSSGVEIEPGNKDYDKLAGFTRAVECANGEIIGNKF